MEPFTMLALAGFGYLLLGGKSEPGQGAAGPPGLPSAPEPVPLPNGENALGLMRASDGTLTVIPAFAATIYPQLEQYAPQLDPSDPRIAMGVPRGQFSAETLRMWADRVILDGAYVLMALDPDRILLRRTVAIELGLARGDEPSWAVFLSPPAGAMPAPSPNAPGGAPGGVGPFPGPPGPIPGGGNALPGPIPTSGIPASLLLLPPELQAKVIPAYASGSARELKDLAAVLARRYPDAATEIRNKSAERWEIEKANASLEGRLVRIPAGKYPSHVAQHYADDFNAWPELLQTNPQLERVGDNLRPWKGEIVLPHWWHAERGPMAAEVKAKVKKAPRPAPPAPPPAPVKRPVTRQPMNGTPIPSHLPVAGEELPS